MTAQEAKEYRNRCKVIGKLLCRALQPNIEKFRKSKPKSYEQNKETQRVDRKDRI